MARHRPRIYAQRLPLFQLVFIRTMPLIDFASIASQLPAAWSSTNVGSVGLANIKVLRMDAQPYQEETHDSNEALLVLEGRLLLQLPSEDLMVTAG